MLFLLIVVESLKDDEPLALRKLFGLRNVWVSSTEFPSEYPFHRLAWSTDRRGYFASIYALLEGKRHTE
ncbi:hypothetical protein NL676_003043 [Syzygium grande]|nr:hypothetical protein NL676_003043 [Syzygium grande]